MTTHYRYILAAAMAAAPVLSTAALAGDLELGKTRALMLIETAQKHPRIAEDRSWRETVKKIRRTYDKAIFHVAPPGQEFSGCEPTTLAFTRAGIHDIFVCRLALRRTTDELASTVIHELAHVAGEHDECLASEKEFVIMQAGGVKPFRTGYVDKCGLAGRFDFQSPILGSADYSDLYVKDYGSEATLSLSDYGATRPDSRSELTLRKRAAEPDYESVVNEAASDYENFANQLDREINELFRQLEKDSREAEADYERDVSRAESAYQKGARQRSKSGPGQSGDY